jgi:hypothetical protein
MLLKASKVFLHISLLSVVIVMTSTFFPFIGGKDYFFRFSVELALVFAVLWWAFEAEDGALMRRFRNIVKKPLFIAVSAFVLAVLLASAFAYDPHAAFWSNYERGEGGFQMLHYYIFFTLLVFLFDKREDWRMFFKTALVSSVLMILYGVFADSGWASNFISQYQGGGGPTGWWQRLVGGRFQGSLGNPAYVAPYLIFSIFYTMYLWGTSKFSNKWISGALYGCLAAIFFFFFMISGTKGAFVGLGVAVYASLVLLGYLERKYRWFSLGSIAILTVVGGMLVQHKTSAFVQALPGGRMFDLPVGGLLLVGFGVAAIALAALIEFAREKKVLWKVLGVLTALFVIVMFFGGGSKIMSKLSDQTTNTRFWTWGSAWKGFVERPILGWGPENFSPVFDKYFDPRHYIPGQNTETWFDRAHSIYFDYLAETGILGFLSYLSIFFVVLWGLIKSIFRNAHSPFAKSLLVGLPLGYLVQGVAIFDVLPMYINLFLFFAFAYFILHEDKEERAEHASHHLKQL